MLKRQVAHRAFLSAYSILLVAVGFLEPASFTHHMRVSGGTPASTCLVLLFAAALLTLVDTVVNDVMSSRFSFDVGLKTRQHVWLFMAVTYAGLAFVAGKETGAVSVALTFFLHASWCAAVAFLDLSFQFAKWGRRMTDREPTA